MIARFVPMHDGWIRQIHALNHAVNDNGEKQGRIVGIAVEWVGAIVADAVPKDDSIDAVADAKCGVFVVLIWETFILLVCVITNFISRRRTIRVLSLQSSQTAAAADGGVADDGRGGNGGQDTSRG